MLRPSPGNRRRPFPVSWRTTGLLALVLALPVRAVDDPVPVDTVDAEFRAKETVRGTIRPAEERETFHIELPRGASLQATAKAKGPGAPAITLEASDPDALVVATVPGGKGTTELPRLVATVSGTHTVRVTGDQIGDGDYQLKLRVKMPRRWNDTSPTELASGAAGEQTFAAGGGSGATLTVAAARHSDCRPAIVRVEGPGTFLFTPPPPDTPGKRHVVRDLVLPETGEYRVVVRNDGAAAGAWTAKTKLRPPVARKTSLDITDDALAGEFAGEQAVVARTVDAEGGTVATSDVDDDLLGVVLDIPPGAVTTPVLITIAQSDDFFVDDDTHAAGTTVQFGPVGLDFTTDATVTVPFDPQGFDPGDEVLVAIEDGDTGEITVVTGTVNAGNTVTFPTSHFSRFQAVSHRPRPLVGGFMELELSGEVVAAGGGSVSMGLHTLVGAKGQRTGNMIARSLDRLTLGWTRQGASGVDFQATADTGNQVGIASADSDLTLTFLGGSTVYTRGRSGDVLVRRDVDAGRAGVSLLLRRATGTVTRGALRGDWHAIVVEYALVRPTTGPSRIVSAGQTFDLSVAIDGRATAHGTRLVTTGAEFPGGRALTTVHTRAPPAGTLRPSVASARLSMALGMDGGLTSVDLVPVVRGDALIGIAKRIEGDPAAPVLAVMRLVILVRQGTQGAASGLTGRAVFGAFGVGVVDSGVGAAGGSDVALELLSFDVLHDGDRSFRAFGDAVTIRHGVGGAVLPSTTVVDVTGTYHIREDLGYEEGVTGRRGALLPRRGLYIDTAFDADGISIGFGLPSRALGQ